MRAIWTVLSAALLSTSCLDLEQRIELAKDGSGVQTLRLAMGNQSLAAAKAQVMACLLYTSDAADD